MNKLKQLKEGKCAADEGKSRAQQRKPSDTFRKFFSLDNARQLSEGPRERVIAEALDNLDSVSSDLELEKGKSNSLLEALESLRGAMSEITKRRTAPVQTQLGAHESATALISQLKGELAGAGMFSSRAALKKCLDMISKWENSRKPEENPNPE